MLIIPLFKIYNMTHLINNHMSLILTYTAFHIPFNAALMRSFISGIPATLEEAARVDGCNRLQAVTHILMPLLLPGIAAVLPAGIPEIRMQTPATIPLMPKTRHPTRTRNGTSTRRTTEQKF